MKNSKQKHILHFNKIINIGQKNKMLIKQRFKVSLNYQKIIFRKK